jgi:hypothetical protein
VNIRRALPLSLLLATLFASGAERRAGAEPRTEAATASNLQHSEDDYGYWSRGQARWFLATKSDLGVGYVKPHFSGGYGQPHWLWTGLDLSSITTFEFTQAYAGVRAASPILDLAFGVRDTWSFEKPLLVPDASYARDDLLGQSGSAARYWAWEGEAVAILPLPHSAIVADFIAVRTLDVPSDRYVYDESYRAVIADPLFMVLRLAPVVRLLNEDALKVGALGEYVFATGRDKPVVRVGPVGALTITNHLEALAGLTLAVSSPDRLGMVLGAYGTACVRYRWATGESDPALPWEGERIP